MSAQDNAVHGAPHEATHACADQSRRDLGANDGAANEAAHQLQRGLFWLLPRHIRPVHREQRKVPSERQKGKMSARDNALHGAPNEATHACADRAHQGANKEADETPVCGENEAPDAISWKLCGRRIRPRRGWDDGLSLLPPCRLRAYSH